MALTPNTGAVSTGRQFFAGKKIWIDLIPSVSTASGNITVYGDSATVQHIDPGGSSRNVTADASAEYEGSFFKFVNNADAAENLVFKNSGGSTIATIGRYQSGEVAYSAGAWAAQVYTSSATGFVAADGTTEGATSQNQVFTAGVTTDEILGNTAAPLTVTALAGASNTIGNALTLAAGAGTGTGAGAVASVVGGAGGVTNAAGGVASLTGGAGGGTGAGAVSRVVGGASGSGATGNGGAAQLTGGAALSTNGTGGAATITGGVATGTGTGGAATLTGGASAGASGTAGSVAIDAGAAAGGTAGTVTIGGSNASSVIFAKAITQGVGASTAAAGSAAGDATALPAGTAQIYPTTGADDAKGVKLTASDQVTGRMIFIGNGVSNKILKVYPPSGGAINGASADAAFSSASGKGVIICCLSSGGNTWLAW